MPAERAKPSFRASSLMGIVAGGWQMARFYADHVLVHGPALRNTVVNGAAGVLALSEEQFLAA